MKKGFAILLIIIFTLSISVPYAAQDTAANYIFDNAEIIDEQTEVELNALISDLAIRRDMSVFIVTKGAASGLTNKELASEFYDDNPSLFTTTYALISVLDPAEQTYLFARINNTADIITDEVTEEMFSHIKENLQNNDIHTLYMVLFGDVYDSVNRFYMPQAQAETPKTNGELLVDSADLLTDKQEEKLLSRLDSLKKKYNFTIVLHTTMSIGDKNIVEYADDFYDYNGYGSGTNHDGLLFMLNMNNNEYGNRDYYTSTCGYGITAFTDYAIGSGQGVINEKILPYLQEEKYYEAFDKYLDLSDKFLAEAAKGKPYDVNNTFTSTEEYLIREAIVLAVGIVVAFIATSVMKGKMNTARIRREAANYAVDGSLSITRSYDIFTHSTVSRTERASENSSGGGGGGSSTHSGSSGSSHGGGGGKF